MTKKAYQFLNEEGKGIYNCIAETHDEALKISGLPFNTDFYSY